MLKIRLAIFRMLVTFLNKAYLRVSMLDGRFSSWLGVVEKRITTRGPVETIGWLKAVRLACHRHLCGEPLSTSPGFGVELDHEGLPTVSAPLVAELFRCRDPSAVRLANTILSVSRIIHGWKAPDLDPITQPCSGIKIGDYANSLASLVMELGWNVPRPLWDGCHVTTKSGPNAQALLSSVEDAHLLTEEQISNLRVCGGDELVERVELIRRFSLLAWLEKFGLTPKGVGSKLSVVKDKEAKARVVAILDYWTQSCLHPLHKALMSFLRRLGPDCTFNQGSFRSKLPSHGPYYSIDLTAATDRFPVEIQEAVLAALVSSKEYAAAWRALICDREYTTTWGNRVRVKYACGQPMGAYSSWTTFAVSHHLIVRLAARRAGLAIQFKDYVLLGDDIVIANAAVAKEYLTIMREIGVQISEAKTFVSKDTYEFAKRVVHVGIEVTGAPLGSLFEAITFVSPKTLKAAGGTMIPTKAIKRVSFYEVATWFREVEARWLRPSETMVSRGLFAEVFALLGRGALAMRLAEKAWKFFLLPSREDSRLLRKSKAEKLGLLLLEGSLGCFSWQRATERICVLLNECKARVLESAIKRHLGVLRDFQSEVAKYVDVVPEGLDAQSLLLLPPFDVLRRNIAELQLEFDKAHRVRESDDISQWLHLDVRLFLDPFSALSKRKSKTNASNKVTILNHLTAMCRGIEMIRQVAISDISLDGLVHLVVNHQVVPTRGDRRKRAPSKQIDLGIRNITNVTGLGKKS